VFSNDFSHTCKWPNAHCLDGIGRRRRRRRRRRKATSNQLG